MALEVAAVVPVPEPAAAPQLPLQTAEQLLEPLSVALPGAFLTPLEQMRPAMTQLTTAVSTAGVAAPAAAAAPTAAGTPLTVATAALSGSLPAEAGTEAAVATAGGGGGGAVAGVPAVRAPAAKPPAPRAPAGYSSDSYWDGRYAGELKQHIQHFDWFFCFTALNALIDRACRNKELPCLHVGCGNSDLSEGMAASGSYRHIVNVDISAVVIKQMLAAQNDASAATAAVHLDNAHRDQADPPTHNLEAWEVADCRAMPQFAAGSFGCVIDKGTLDAVLCSATGAKDVGAYVREVHRVLSPGGAFLLITLGRPIARLAVLAGDTRHPNSSGSSTSSSNASGSSIARAASVDATTHDQAAVFGEAARGAAAAAAAAAARTAEAPKHGALSDEAKAAAVAAAPAPLLEWGSIEVLLLPKPDAYMASEASIMGRPYVGRRNSSSGESVHKCSPVQWMGPFAPKEVEAQVAEQQLDLQEYFFAYILTKPAGE